MLPTSRIYLFFYFFWKNSRCSTLCSVRGSFYPQGRVWLRQRQDGRAWLKLQCLDLLSFALIWGRPALLMEGVKHKAAWASCTTDSVAYRAHLNIFRHYCSLGLWVCLHECERRRGIQRHSVRARVINKHRLVTTVSPYRKWACSCNSLRITASGQQTVFLKEGDSCSAAHWAR